MENWSEHAISWIADLRTSRPVFHSKADFQHTFAHTIRRMSPDLHVHSAAGNGADRVDVLVSAPDRGRHLALRLKYPRAAWCGDVDGQRYDLKNHGAHDVHGYDAVKDVRDVEWLVDRNLGWSGGVVMLTNDPLYWRMPDHDRPTIADDFRLYEGNRLTGVHEWGPGAGPGTTHKREEALELRGDYVCRWSDYAQLGGYRGEFRFLVVPIERTSSHVG